MLRTGKGLSTRSPFGTPMKERTKLQAWTANKDSKISANKEAIGSKKWDVRNLVRAMHYAPELSNLAYQGRKRFKKTASATGYRISNILMLLPKHMIRTKNDYIVLAFRMEPTQFNDIKRLGCTSCKQLIQNYDGVLKVQKNE